MLLNTLISLYGTILLISTLMSFYMWYLFRHKLIKNLVLFWLSGILGFFAQGLFQELNTFGLMAFCVNSLTVIQFLKIFSDGANLKLPIARYGFFLFLGSLAALLSFLVSENYVLSATIYCITCSSVITHGAFSKKSFAENRDGILNGFRFLLLFDALHFLDYPFVRTNQNLAVVGFSVTLIFFFSFAIFVPVFIFRQISLDYTNRLKLEVDIRTQQLAESNLQLNLAFNELKTAKSEIEVVLQDNRTRLSALVHDISNPLQVIFFNLNSLMTNPNQFLSRLTEKKEKLDLSVKVVKQILAEAKDTHSMILGKTSVTLTKVMIDEVVSELISVFDEQLKKKGVAVEVDLSSIGKNQPILANEGWLRNQILSNLMSNAIKFSEANSIIKIVGRVLPNGRVSIAIIDAGVGISDSKKLKLFDMQNITTSLGTMGEVGSGLGLPIVKQYTELMGGEIFVKDSEPRGTCFEVHFSSAAA